MDSCPWHPILFLHAGGEAQQGQWLVGGVLMKLYYLPFNLIFNYSLAEFWPLLSSVVVICRKTMHFLPAKV